MGKLVIARKPGEEVFISGAQPEDKIIITVLQCHGGSRNDGGGRTRLGIEAPLNVTILRAEISEDGPAKKEITSGSKEA